MFLFFYFKHYVHDHPEVAVVDPLENLTKLMDRHYTYQFVKECEVLEKGMSFYLQMLSVGCLLESLFPTHGLTD